MPEERIRLPIALGLVAVATALAFQVRVLSTFAFLWFLLGIAVGLLLRRWWALVVSPIPRLDPDRSRVRSESDRPMVGRAGRALGSSHIDGVGDPARLLRSRHWIADRAGDGRAKNRLAGSGISEPAGVE